MVEVAACTEASEACTEEQQLVEVVACIVAWACTFAWVVVAVVACTEAWVEAWEPEVWVVEEEACIVVWLVAVHKKAWQVQLVLQVAVEEACKQVSWVVEVGACKKAWAWHWAWVGPVE